MTVYILLGVIIAIQLISVLALSSSNDDHKSLETGIERVLREVNDDRYRSHWADELHRNGRISSENGALRTENKYLKQMLESIKNDSDNTSTIFYNGMPYTIKSVTLHDEADNVPYIDVEASIYPPVPKKDS